MNRKACIILLSSLLLILLPAIALAALTPTVETLPYTYAYNSYDIDNVVTLNATLVFIGSSNVTLRGFIYDTETHSNPELEASLDEPSTLEYDFWVLETCVMTGGANYTANITYLESDTRYFFRAAVMNSSDESAFGEEETFVTVAEATSTTTENVTADEMADIADTLSTYLDLFVIGLAVCGLVSLAFIRSSMILYVLSGIAVLVFGLYFTDTHMAIGALIAILGLYCFWKALEVR